MLLAPSSYYYQGRRATPAQCAKLLTAHVVSRVRPYTIQAGHCYGSARRVTAAQALDGIACLAPLLLAGAQATAAAFTPCLCSTHAQVSAAIGDHEGHPRTVRQDC